MPEKNEQIYEVIGRAIDAHVELNMFVEICLSGLDAATAATVEIELHRRVASTLKRPDPFPNVNEFNRHLERAKKIETFAEREKERGYPYLFGLAAIRLWSLLTASVDDLAVFMLEHPAYTPKCGEIIELEGPLLQFANANSREQAEILAELLKDRQRARLRSGISRLETVLDPFDLTGSVPENVRRTIFELSNVRNVLIHMNGIVDPRFREACPWIEWPEGHEVRLIGDHLRAYGLAASWYFLELHRRVHDKWEESLVATEVALSESIALQGELVEALDVFWNERDQSLPA
jgi:hypothetical protein